MILYIRGENYRSIGETQTINFMANADKSHNNMLLENETRRILPVISLYGGNATGKTNLLRLIKTLVGLVTGCLKLESAYEPCKFYPEKEETTIDIMFVENNIKYYYGISYTDKEILEESLFYYPKGKISKIFLRKNGEFSFGNDFESELRKYSDNLSSSACFLFTISTFLGEKSVVLNEVNKFFKEKFVFINLDKNTYTLEDTIKIFKEKEKREHIKKFIEYFYSHMNIGAVGVRFSANLKLENEKMLELLYRNRDKIQKVLEKDRLKLNFELEQKKLLDLLPFLDKDRLELIYEIGKQKIEIPIQEESDGIKKIFTLGMPIADALCNDKIVVFDEIEVGFHPLLSKKIIELFSIKNKKAQLLFTTHNTNLLNLELFRRDQIYFATRTKDTSFRTLVKSLGEIPGVRKSADIEKAYLEGKYSDVPLYDKFDKEEVGEILCCETPMK